MTCSFDPCINKIKAVGLCNTHYGQRLRGETLHAVATQRPRGMSESEWFWARADKSASGGCWLWTRGKSDTGYGSLQFAGRITSSHRVAYELARGPLAEHEVIDHQCRNRLCVNPAHLKAGTQKQNAENVTAHADSSSGIRGVIWDERTHSWCARVTHNGKTNWGGRHRTMQQAERAAIALRNRLFTNNVLDREREDARQQAWIRTHPTGAVIKYVEATD